MGKKSIDVSRRTAVVLDSWAVMAYFEDEASADAVEDIMAQAHASSVPLLMTVVNVGEVWYSVARRRSEKDADERVKDIGELGVSIVAADWKIAYEAARFKRGGRIAYADCFAAGLAKLRNAPLVTGDPEFKALESRISILWV